MLFFDEQRHFQASTHELTHKRYHCCSASNTGEVFFPRKFHHTATRARFSAFPLIPPSEESREKPALFFFLTHNFRMFVSYLYPIAEKSLLFATCVHTAKGALIANFRIFRGKMRNQPPDGAYSVKIPPRSKLLILGDADVVSDSSHG